MQQIDLIEQQSEQVVQIAEVLVKISKALSLLSERVTEQEHLTAAICKKLGITVTQ